MIFYETDTWSSQIFRFHGTVWAGIWKRWFLIVGYGAASYYYCVHIGRDLGEQQPTSNILGSLLSVLLVFRANTAYARYWEGRTILTTFFTELREVIALALVCLPGGKGHAVLRWRRRTGSAVEESVASPEMDQLDKNMMADRVDIIRWCVVLAIAMQAHARILEEGLIHRELSRETKWSVDWDRYRIRHLTTEKEFKSIDAYVRQLAVPQTLWDTPTFDKRLSGAKGLWDGACPTDGPGGFEVNTVPAMRLPMAVLLRLSAVIARCINDPRAQNRPWGMPERFATVFIGFTSKMMRDYTMMGQVICTPTPYPYFHLCKTLLIVYFLAFPFFVEHEMGIWVNVVEPSFLTLALLGVDAIAIELENPFGDDDNDLDMCEKISVLEEEAMLFLSLSGDQECMKNFQWLEMPKPMAASCPKYVDRFLALRSQVESDGGSAFPTVGGSVRREVAVVEDNKAEESDFSDDS